MSGAFETAAGAFAVVGVADVVIRTGREIYSFLSNVADAPDSLRRLRDKIEDITILALVCKQCLEKLEIRAQHVAVSITPFDSAMKSLDRELQRLKIMVTKFNSRNATWSRVKYALDERKIERLLSSLDRSKLLLANALAITYGELSTNEHQTIEALVQNCSQQVGLKTDSLAQLLKTTLDAHQHTIQVNNRSILASQESVRQDLTRLNSQSEQILASSDFNHKVIASKLDINQQKLSSVSKLQQQGSITHSRLLRKTEQNHKQVALISKKLSKSRGTSNNNHKITRDMLTTLTTKVEQLDTVSTGPTSRIVQSGREIYFLGERRDMIMAYLLSIKDHLKHAIDEILSQRVEGVSARHACWLEREFGELLGSAAQNEAARYSNSTATAFDQWSFSEDTITLSGGSDFPQVSRAQENKYEDNLNNKTTSLTQFHSRLRHFRRTLVFDTSTGTLSISFPQDKTGCGEILDSDDIRVSFLSKVSQPFMVLNAYFFQRMINASRSRVCVQLNAFTPISGLQFEVYDGMIENGTIDEIDTAIREGTISPYGVMTFPEHSSIDHGEEMTLLSVVLGNGRVDLLDYLDAQGIGITNLRHDSGVLWGCLIYKSELGNQHDRDRKIATVVSKVLDKLIDPLAFAARFALTQPFAFPYFRRSKPQNEPVYQMLRKLRSLGYQCPEQDLPRDDASKEEEEPWNLLRERLRFILTLSPGVAIEARIFMLWAQKAMFYLRKRCSLEEFKISRTGEEVLVIWLENVQSISCRTFIDETMSMVVRRYGFWDEWHRALQRRGKELNEVLREEGTEWLERDDWKVVWCELYTETSPEIHENWDGDEDDDTDGESVEEVFVEEESEDEEYQIETSNFIDTDSE